MILVSFSSMEDAGFNDVKKYDTFRSQGTENQPFRIFWDTRYNMNSVESFILLIGYIHLVMPFWFSVGTE